MTSSEYLKPEQDGQRRKENPYSPPLTVFSIANKANMAATLTRSSLPDVPTIHDGHTRTAHKHTNGHICPSPSSTVNVRKSRTSSTPAGVTPQSSNTPKGKPVEDDFMYELEGRAILPTTDRLKTSIQKDEDPQTIASDWLAMLSQAAAKGDGDMWTDLFWDNGVWRDKVVFTFEYRSFNGEETIRRAAKVRSSVLRVELSLMCRFR